jgi:putative heme-binding domain-containing protein
MNRRIVRAINIRLSWAAGWIVCVLVTIVVPAAARPGVGSMATGHSAQAAAPPQVDRDEILAYHTKDEKGGSAETGRPLFEQRCAICHRFGGIGKDVGPDLTTVTSRFKKKDILESILWPSKVISDQYQTEMFELSDGKVVTGVIVRETAAAVLVRTSANPDKPVAVTKAQIANRVPGTVSLMPDGLLDDLSPKQISDLLAFVMAPPPDK